MEFRKDITEKGLRIFSRRGNWNLVKTLLKNALKIFEERHLEFRKDITEKCLRKFSRRGNWNLVKTLLKNVLEYFRGEATGIS